MTKHSVHRPRPSRPHLPGRFGRAAVAGVLALAALSTAACGAGSKSTAAAATSSATRMTGPTATVSAPAPTGTGDTAGTSSASTNKPKVAKLADPNVVGRAVGGQAITVGDVSLVARANVASIKVYPTATSTSPRWTLSSPLPSGAPLVFLVQERQGDRLRVLVPVRPNQSQGWVRVADVALSQHNYRMVVSIGKHTLTLYQAGRVVLQVPAGLGTGSTPTPGGVFYTKELLRPSNPSGAYGPYAYGLSGYSTVLDNFGGGDGELGIHGTNDPASIGRNVSHGCIRISNANVTKLAGMLPLGVPVQIVS